MSSSEFSSQVALITGAASGFGLAAARAFAEAGASVVGVSREVEELTKVFAGLPIGHGARHFALSRDLRPAEAAGQVVADAVALAGPVDILVNSAGVCHFRRPADIVPTEWDEILEVNLRALFYMGVAVAERADPVRKCRIINIGSNAGRRGRALTAHYAAAKAAVANLTESLAIAYGPKNITVNTVCPAMVLTPLWDECFRELGALTGKTPAQLTTSWEALTPLRRLGTVDDVTNLILFLASERAEFITGQEINVCGGYMLTC